ncbi:vWA domain-containing protein [Vibrio algicola]|uniref:VWA domain-containing protein n=1 Tax=Vibrio algicola TaxID=2662262 RepID=A0A5Q0TI88_9VIBR|nr:VWA domain-containing protein [Vibrio algicola]
MADFQFLHPYWLFAAIPALMLSVWLFRHANTTSLIASHLSQQLGLDKKQSHRTLASAILSAWLIAVLALAGPSFQKQEVPSFSVNNARVIVMDMTLSMYATDIAPNRLTQARYKMLDLLPTLNEGTTGLVAYSGDGYMISPLTSDSKTLANLIPNLSPDIMPTQGSNAAAGVKKAIDMLTQAGHMQGDIVLVSDDVSRNESQDIAKLLKGTEWRLSVMSVGTQQGAPIKLPNGDMFTSHGTTVVAKTNINGLQSLAKVGNGIYTPLRTDDADVQAIAKTLHHVQLKSAQANKGSPELEVHTNNGFWLLPILLLLALGGFRRGGIFSIALLMTLPMLSPRPAFAADYSLPTSKAPVTQAAQTGLIDSIFKTPDQQGFDAYQHKAYAQAANRFENKAWQSAAQYQAGNYQAAIDNLQGSSDEDSRYNLANAQAQAGKLADAKKGYEAILAQNPNNHDAKTNLDIVNKALEQQKQQQKKQQNQKDNKQDQKSKDNKDNKDNKDQNKQQDNKKQDHSKQKQSKSEQEKSKSEQEKSKQDQSKSEQKQHKDNQQKQSEQNKQQQQQQQQNQDKQQKAQQDKSKQQHAKQEQQAKQQDSKQQQGKQSKPQALTQADPNNKEKPSNTVAVDPQLNKLQQIPDDAKRLLQAQMALEAQQNPAPQSTGQQW